MEKLQEAGGYDVSEVEDIYPCSPIQELLQVGQIMDSGIKYKIVCLIAIDAIRGNEHVDVEQLKRSWQQVVNRHPILRTVFVESPRPSGLYDQVVLKYSRAKIVEEEDPSNPDQMELVQNIRDEIDFIGNGPPHRLTLFRRSQQHVLCRLEVNHTIIDGASYGVILRDWALAYMENLSPVPEARYKDYVTFVQKQENTAALAYWSILLEGVKPCHFPAKQPTSQPAAIRRVVVPNLQSLDVGLLYQKHKLTLFNALQVIWSLVLQAYTGMDDVCFGYVTSGRDLPIDRIESLVGPLVNTLVCRVHLDSSSSLLDTMRIMREQRRNNSRHQTPLMSVQRALGLSGTRLFNTAINARRSQKDVAENEAVSIRGLGRREDSEYDIVILSEGSDEVTITLYYSSACLSDEEAVEIADTISRLLPHCFEPEFSLIASLQQLISRNTK
ncbi:hypothetical protein MPH_02965 [Macrophomina phaseolina MS6]|uniref:Condensation domain-containing protein n=1 Tax=Macrophomina phaseolina (strain MS6) TaxID=1126212 RepID=K2RYA6_MACPH|nr:hypothetical protein MPH_02965 [Macrophomina phaseolina MS6]